jgi:hypothetical protein
MARWLWAAWCRERTSAPGLAPLPVPAALPAPAAQPGCGPPGSISSVQAPRPERMSIISSSNGQVSPKAGHALTRAPTAP